MLTILFLKIDNKVLICEIAVILLFSLLGLLGMVICYYADKNMIHQINIMSYAMIEDTLYGCLIALSILSGFIRYLGLIIKYLKNK